MYFKKGTPKPELATADEAIFSRLDKKINQTRCLFYLLTKAVCIRIL
jgi:hypothetical protein